MFRVLCWAALLVGAAAAALPTRADTVEEEGQIDAVAAVSDTLDALHDRAAEADFDGYFALFHPRATFLGTDRDEIWPLAEFKTYTAKRFASGSGWTYVPTHRNVYISGSFAWFDERVVNETLGETRGTGTLIKDAAGWRVAQYNLTLPIPNELIREIAVDVQTHYGEAAN